MVHCSIHIGVDHDKNMLRFLALEIFATLLSSNVAVQWPASERRPLGFVPLFDRNVADLPVAEITPQMVAAAPDAIDWSLKGAVTPVRYT